MNHFMLECASICPETTHQKLESKRVYLTLFDYEFVCEDMSEDLCMCGFNYTAFSRKLSKLRLSFSLCNYVTYRRTFLQSMARFYFLCRNAIF